MSLSFSSIFDAFALPFGWINWFIYQYIPNYGMTLILFTLLTKLIMLPFAFKQQQSMIKMAAVQPKMNALKIKYASNQKRFNEELAKLYEQEGYNPASSCLPTLIQMPILLGLIQVIYKPLQYVLRLDGETITKAVNIARAVLGEGGMNAYSEQISVLNAFRVNAAPFVTGLGPELANKIGSFDFSMFGIQMGAQPTLSLAVETLPLMLIPLLSGASAFLMSWLSMKQNADIGMSETSNNAVMMYSMPLLSVYIAFKVPAGVGFYWLISNVFSAVQTWALYKFYNPALIAQEKAQEERAAKERERKERIEAKRLAASGETPAPAAVEDAADPELLITKSMSQKEINRIKLTAARKRIAQQYGEEYVEVTDADLK